MEKSSVNIKWLTRSAILLAVALVFQLGGFPQFITGPVINTVLYLAVILVGVSSGILIGILTPVIAFMTGILPPVLAPMIPFIAIGNGLLAVVFSLLKPVNSVLGVLGASIIKFGLLAIAVTFLVDVPGPVAQMMSTPQLITAIAGGIFALIIYKGLQSAGIESNK